MAGALLEDKENMAPANANAIVRGGVADKSAKSAEAPRKGEDNREARLLHYGEEVPLFFYVRGDETERLQAIDKLWNNFKSPELWLEVLKALPPHVKPFGKKRIIRRALTLMGEPRQNIDVPSYVQIWILYAKVQTTEKDTREVFDKMNAERIGEQQAMFYEEFAAFEYSLGNITASDEVLNLGVRRKVYDKEEMRKMQTRVTTGKLASPAFFPEAPISSAVVKEEVLEMPREAPGTGRLSEIKSEVIGTSHEMSSTRGFPSVKQEILQTPREAPAARGMLTPRNNARGVLPVSTAISTPVGVVKPTPGGLSTVSKLSRKNDDSVLTTPSFAARPSAKSQSTTRKSSMNSSRLRTLGGPPLRVIASANLNDSKSDEDEDEEMESPSPREKKKTSPPQSAQPPARPAKKAFVGDLSYIMKWDPQRPASSFNPPQPTTTTVTSGTAPSAQKQPRSASTFVAGFGTDSRQHDQLQLPSPKRLQIDAGVPLVSRGVESSPHSVSSVSSASSPPLISGDKKMMKDPFGSLSSKVVVDGLTYIKLEQIGSGGSSKVYRMLGPDLKIYALKKIKLKRLDEKSIEQYTNEIQLLQRLQGNPHIIRLVAAEQDLQQRQINVVMEHGEIDLSDRLRDLKDGMDENFLRVIWMQMLQAVHAIHRERIIHGDLKPANFLFVNGALKLIDFGIAKAISNDTTNIERDSQVGTVNYMSPEAIQGNATPNGQRNPHGKMKVGRASDIWSLGCILYQIVYGKPPFADVHSIIEKFRCIIDPSVPIPFPPLNNKDLEGVIRSCLQRDHRARPHIDGEGGLLRHPFLRSSNGAGGSVPIVTLDNASEVLSQLGDLLDSQGVDVTSVSTFLSIGERGLRGATRKRYTSPRIGYNTQERRTEI